MIELNILADRAVLLAGVAYSSLCALAFNCEFRSLQRRSQRPTLPSRLQVATTESLPGWNATFLIEDLCSLSTYKEVCVCMSTTRAVWSPEPVTRSASSWEKEMSMTALSWGLNCTWAVSKDGDEFSLVSRIRTHPPSSPIATKLFASREVVRYHEPRAVRKKGVPD